MTKEEYVTQLEIYEKELTDEHWKYNNPYDILEWHEKNFNMSWEGWEDLEDRAQEVISEFFGA